MESDFVEYQHTLGQRTEISFLDAKTISQVYCDGYTEDGCKNGGYKLNGRKCECSDGFTGNKCEKVIKSKVAECDEPLTPITANFIAITEEISISNEVPKSCSWEIVRKNKVMFLAIVAPI